MMRAPLTIATLVSAALACHSSAAHDGQAAGAPPSGQHATATPVGVGSDVPPLPCFTPDSNPIAFGSLDTSNLDQDVSGTQVSFEVRTGKLFGYIREAAGQIPLRQPLESLSFSSATDTLAFIYRTGDEKARYRYHVSCVRLAGMARLFVTATDTGTVVRNTLTRSIPTMKP